MLRLILLFVLAVVLLFVSIIALAAYYLPWWGVVLVVVGLLLFLRYGLPKLIGAGFRKLIVGFLNRFIGQLGAGLKGATARVHDVQVVPPVPEDRWLTEPKRNLEPRKRGEPAREDPDMPLKFFAIDMTVTPVAGAREGWRPEHIAVVGREQAEKADAGIMGLAGAVTHNPVLAELLTDQGDPMPEVMREGRWRTVASSVVDEDGHPVEVAGEAGDSTDGPRSLVRHEADEDEEEHSDENWQDELGFGDATEVHGPHRVRLTYAVPEAMSQEVRLIYFTHELGDARVPSA